MELLLSRGHTHTHTYARNINKFRCYEAKIAESEKAGSCQESNPDHFEERDNHLCQLKIEKWRVDDAEMLVTGFVGKVRLFLYVDNDLAFFSVKTDSSMDIYPELAEPSALNSS